MFGTVWLYFVAFGMYSVRGRYLEGIRQCCSILSYLVKLFNIVSLRVIPFSCPRNYLVDSLICLYLLVFSSIETE